MPLYEPGSKLLVLGMGDLQPLIGNPYNGYINPYYWVDDHPLLYGNNVSLDPSTYTFLGVSENRGGKNLPNHPLGIRFFHYLNHPFCFFSPPIFGNISSIFRCVFLPICIWHPGWRKVDPIDTWTYSDGKWWHHMTKKVCLPNVVEEKLSSQHCCQELFGFWRLLGGVEPLGGRSSAGKISAVSEYPIKKKSYMFYTHFCFHMKRTFFARIPPFTPQKTPCFNNKNTFHLENKLLLISINFTPKTRYTLFSRQVFFGS